MINQFVLSTEPVYVDFYLHTKEKGTEIEKISRHSVEDWCVIRYENLLLLTMLYCVKWKRCMNSIQTLERSAVKILLK